MKTPDEHDEQVAFCEYLDFVHVTYFAVPNGSNKSMTARKKFKAEGLKAGVPDMVLLFEGGKAVFIEMKRKKGGTVSKDQKLWLERLRVLGFDAYVCRGCAEAIEVAKKYLKEDKKSLNVKQGSLI